VIIKRCWSRSRCLRCVEPRRSNRWGGGILISRNLSPERINRLSDTLTQALASISALHCSGEVPPCDGLALVVSPQPPVLDQPLAALLLPAPPVWGFGVRELTFQAGVRPPSTYGFGVREDVFQAGVRAPSSAYGFGVREDAVHAGVRPSVEV
jgi:hypothetical protein